MYECATRCPKVHDGGLAGYCCLHADGNPVARPISDDRLRTVCNTTKQVSCTGPSKIEVRDDRKRL